MPPPSSISTRVRATTTVSPPASGLGGGETGGVPVTRTVRFALADRDLADAYARAHDDESRALVDHHARRLVRLHPQLLDLGKRCRGLAQVGRRRLERNGRRIRDAGGRQAGRRGQQQTKREHAESRPDGRPAHSIEGVRRAWHGRISTPFLANAVPRRPKRCQALASWDVGTEEGTRRARRGGQTLQQCGKFCRQTAGARASDLRSLNLTDCTLVSIGVRPGSAPPRRT